MSIAIPYTPIAYILYIIASIFITVFVARTLSKNGRIYLIDGFNGDVDLADSVNHMLVVGFYLVNLGIVLLRMRVVEKVEDFEKLIVYLSGTIGFVLLFLGAAHFFNMFVIFIFRKSHVNNKNQRLRRDEQLEPTTVVE